MWYHLDWSLYTIILSLGFDSGRYLSLQLSHANQRSGRGTCAGALQANVSLCLLIHRCHKRMRNLKTKHRIGNVNHSRHLEVSPNLNTLALTYCSVPSFIMLNLLVKACRVHSHLFCRGLDVIINF